MDFSAIFMPIANAAYDFNFIFDFLYEFIFIGLATDTNILGLWELLLGAIEPYIVYVPFVLVALCLLPALLGKRIFSFLRFLAFFGAGFILSVHLLSPLIEPFIPGLPAWVIGVITGVVAAVLSKFLYYILYALVSGYCVYIIIFKGMILPELMTFATGNMLVSLAFAAAAIIIAFLLRKYIEMMGTALLGAWGIAETVRLWWDYPALDAFVGIEFVPVLVITLALGIICFIIQFVTRVRYE